MSIIRWNPFRELEDIHARLNRLAGEPDNAALMFADWTPAVDIQETGKEYLIKADLPDVKKEDVRVELHDGMLTLEGERRLEKEEKDKRFHKIERSYGKFVRRFAVPTEIEANAVAAEFKDGVLNVRLPKSVNVKPRAIEVKVA